MVLDSELPHPTSKLESHPFSVIHDSLFNTFKTTSPYLETVSSTHNLRTCHAVGTRDASDSQSFYFNRKENGLAYGNENNLS
jgi:hypothetical protein